MTCNKIFFSICLRVQINFEYFVANMNSVVVKRFALVDPVKLQQLEQQVTCNSNNNERQGGGPGRKRMIHHQQNQYSSPFPHEIPSHYLDNHENNWNKKDISRTINHYYSESDDNEDDNINPQFDITLSPTSLLNGLPKN